MLTSIFFKQDFNNVRENHLHVVCSGRNYQVIVVVFSNFFAVFEEAFSMFDVNASGNIQFKFLFPLLRNLGYNIHKAEAWWSHLVSALDAAGIKRSGFSLAGTITLCFCARHFTLMVLLSTHAVVY